MKKTQTTTKPKLIPISEMRPEDQGRERIPWKEMEVGGIYQRKDGRYYIYAGRAVVYHNNGVVSTRESDKHNYSYIYIDGPGVLCKIINEDMLTITCGSAKIRSSEYRDIARTKVGQIEGFTTQSHWNFGSFAVITDPAQHAIGSTRRKVDYTEKDIANYQTYLKKTAKKRTRKAAARAK